MSDPGRTTVLLVDDHEIVRAALRSLLEAQEDLEVLGEAGDLASAKEAVAATAPRVLVLDVNLPDGMAVDALAEIRQLAPDTAVLLLTMERDPGFAHRALEGGALGYMLKDSAHLELIEAVREVSAGRTYLPEAVAARLAKSEGEGERSPLSPRETEVLRLMALGHTNREIGEQLELSVRTVETHRSHIQQKLGLSTRSELTRYALDNRLIDTRSSS